MEQLLDICRRMTRLTGRQMEELRLLSIEFQLMADLAYAHLTVYAPAKERNKLVIVAQNSPNTCFGLYRPQFLGTKLPMSEEPVVTHTLTTGEAVNGRREWSLGVMLDMYTFAIRDEVGAVIACVCFDASREELNIAGYPYLLETVCALLQNRAACLSTALYRPLSASDGVIITDRHGKIRFANAAAASIYKALGAGRMLGCHIFDRCFTKHIVRETVLDGESGEKEIEVGKMILVQRSIPLIGKDRLYRTILIISDVTELRKKDKELLVKSAVIQEIHHRVKNNLQTIASLLRLQARRTKSPEARAALHESVNRILSISVVHEFLSQQDEEEIDVTVVAQNLLKLITQNMLEPDFVLELQFEGAAMILPSHHASSLALVMNEIIQNAVEHAFVGRADGVIGVKIAVLPHSYSVEIYDNGKGIAGDYEMRKSRSLGLQIVTTLIQDELGGSFRIYNANGTRVEIVIPRNANGGQSE